MAAQRSGILRRAVLSAAVVVMVMCLGFGTETLFLDDWPASRWFAIAAFCGAMIVCMNLPARERRKWREAHSFVFQFVKDSYTDRLAWVVVAYGLAAIIVLSIIVYQIAEWLRRLS